MKLAFTVQLTGSEMIGNVPRYKKNQSPSLVIMTLRPRFLKSRENKKKTEKMARGELSYSDFVFDMLLDFVNIFLVKKK